MRQEVDPVTEAGKEGTLCFFNEAATHNCFPGGKQYVENKEPFWVVELFADAGFFNQKRRDAAQLALGKAFVTVLGDDGTSTGIGAAYMLRPTI
jgi:hypothetical protein